MIFLLIIKFEISVYRKVSFSAWLHTEMEINCAVTDFQ